MFELELFNSTAKHLNPDFAINVIKQSKTLCISNSQQADLFVCFLYLKSKRRYSVKVAMYAFISTITF